MPKAYVEERNGGYYVAGARTPSRESGIRAGWISDRVPPRGEDDSGGDDCGAVDRRTFLSIFRGYPSHRTNGVASETRILPITPTNPSLFSDTSAYAEGYAENFAAFALNSDGTRHGPQNPAKAASSISLFLNGAGDGPVLPPGGVFQAPTGQSLGIDAIVGSQSAEVLKVGQATPYVWKVDVRLPVDLGPLASIGAALISLSETNLQDGFYIPAGPFNWSFSYGLAGDVIPSPNPLVVWVRP